MGSNVVSGSGTAAVVAVGEHTLFGSMAAQVSEEAVETSFSKGVNAVSWVLIRFMMVMVPLVFVINGLTKEPFIQSRASAPVTLLTFTGIALLTIIPFTAFGRMLGFIALPMSYFAYLIPCILLYMILATSLKKAYVRHYGELL